MHSGTPQKRKAQRARVILLSAEGASLPEISRESGLSVPPLIAVESVGPRNGAHDLFREPRMLMKPDGWEDRLR